MPLLDDLFRSFTAYVAGSCARVSGFVLDPANRRPVMPDVSLRNKTLADEPLGEGGKGEGKRDDV